MAVLLEVWAWLKNHGLTHLVALLIGLAVAVGWAYFHGKRVQRDQAATAQVAVQKENLNAEGKAEIQKAEAVGRAGDSRAAADYLLGLCRDARTEAHSGN